MRRARTSTIFALPCDRVGDDPGLRAGERDRLVAEVVDRHRRERAGDPLADGDQHVELARLRARRDLVREREELVGRAAHRREDADDAVAGLARGDEPAGDAPSAAPGRRPRCRRTSSRRCRRVAGASRSTAGDGSNASRHSVSVGTDVCRLHLAAAGERAAERDLVGVLEVAADRAGRSRAGSRARGRAGGRRGRRRSPRRSCSGSSRARPPDAVPLDALQQLVDAQVLGLDAVERRERAAEHVVEAAELVRALERDEVDRLLDDADRACGRGARRGRSRTPPPRSGCRTRGRSGRAPSPPRSRARARAPLLRALEEVEREPLRRALPDAGQPRQLRDEVLDRGREHAPHSACPVGRTTCVPAGRRAERAVRAAAARGRRAPVGSSRSCATRPAPAPTRAPR